MTGLEPSPNSLLGAVTGAPFTHPNEPDHLLANDVSPTTDTPRDDQPSKLKSSSVQLIAEDIERYFCGRSLGADIWLQYYLSPSDLTTLQKLIRESSWEDKVRYDYFPRTSIFVLRMSASIQHESAEEGFCKILFKHLERLGSGDPAAEKFVDDICNERHTAIGEGKIGTHSPDAQFRHLQAHYPGVILEVAYSQKSKDLRKLARIYITEGMRGTKLVVGVDQDYARSKKIVFRTWRRQIEPSSGTTPPQLSIEHQSQEFRSHDGNPIPGSRLQIPIADFAPEDLVPESLRDKSIVITSEEYCHYLHKSERSQEMRAAQNARVDDLPSGIVCPPSQASSASDIPSDDDEERLEAIATAHEEDDGD